MCTIMIHKSIVGNALAFSVIVRGFDALFYRIPFSERKNIILEESKNNIEETTNNDENVNNVEITESESTKIILKTDQ